MLSNFNQENLKVSIIPFFFWLIVAYCRVYIVACMLRYKSVDDINEEINMEEHGLSEKWIKMKSTLKKTNINIEK